MKQKIKWIVHTTTSERDYNGNCYHFARITSTKTGKSIVIDHVGGERNAVGLLFRTPEDGAKPVANDWSEIYDHQTVIGKRDWQRMNKFANGKIYEHDVTPKMLRALARNS